MREKFDQILKKYNIYEEDVSDILNAVYDMLVFVAEETKRNEPYATNSIERLESAAHEVWNLTTDL